MRLNYRKTRLRTQTEEPGPKAFRLRDVSVKSAGTPRAVRDRLQSTIGRVQLGDLQATLANYSRRQAEGLKTDKFFATVKNRRQTQHTLPEAQRDASNQFRVKTQSGGEPRTRRHVSLNLRPNANTMAKQATKGNPELVRMLREKLKDREVPDLRPRMHKVVEYVETKSYLKSRIEERLRTIAEQKGRREEKTKIAGLKNEISRRKQSLLGKFVTKRRELKQMLKTLAEEKERENSAKLAGNAGVCRLAMFLKIAGLAKRRLVMKRTVTHIQRAKQMRLDICAKRLKTAAAVLSQRRDERASRILTGYARLKLGCLQHFRTPKELIAKMLMSLYINKKIEQQCEELRYLFKMMTGRLKRSNVRRRFMYGYIKTNTAEFYNRLKLKLSDVDFIDRYYARICKAMYLLHLHTYCVQLYVRYNTTSFLVSEPKQSEDTFYNEVVKLLLYYFPLKGIGTRGLTVSRFLNSGHKAKILDFVETLLLNIYIGKVA